MPIDEFEKLSGLKKGRKLGTGVRGTVYSIRDNPKLVVKQQPLRHHHREVPIALYLSKKRVIPKVYDVYDGRRNGYIVQERYDGTLGNIMDRKKRSISRTGNLSLKNQVRLKNAVHRFHRTGVIHLNMHADNIVYKKTPKGLVFKVIDPGWAVKVKPSITGAPRVKKETEKLAKKMFPSSPYNIKVAIDRELQFYKGHHPPKVDYSKSQLQLNLFK